MQAFALLALLSGLAAAEHISTTCQNLLLDADSAVLTATCDSGQATGSTIISSLDLNDCLGFDPASKTIDVCA